MAGCGITFMLTTLGAIVGGLIGLLKLDPMPPRHGESDGLVYLIVSAFHFGGGFVHFLIGAASGGAVGLVAGIVMTVLLVRRKKRGAANG